MSSGNLISKHKSAFLVLLVLSWTYILLRAWKVQFGIDEAATFFMYVQTGRFLPPGATVDANNHLLNSFLTFFFYSIFGSNPFVLRLPNLLAALVFFYYIYKIACFLSSNTAKYLFIFLILSSHFLLEFFGYCRGYGLSMAFLAGTIYYLLLAAGKPVTPSLLFKSLVFNLLAILSNLNLVFTGIGIIAILIFFVFYHRNLYTVRIKFSLILMILLISLPGFLFFIYQSLQIRSAAGFYYGSGDGFYPVTVESLSAMISGQSFKLFGYYAMLLMCVIFICMFIQRIWKNWKEPKTIFPVIFLVLLLSNWIGALGIHYLMNVNFQEDRAAVHLLPLFYGFVSFGLDPWLKKKTRWLYLILLPLLLIPIHFISQVSLSNSVYGPGQQFPVKYYRYIKDIAKKTDYPPTISSYQVRRQTWDFMNYRDGGFLNPLHVSDYPYLHADFVITGRMPDNSEDQFVAVLTDKRTNTTLYKNQDNSARQVLQVIPIDKPVQSKELYYLLHEFNVDSLKGHHLFFQVDMIIEGSAVPFESVIVVEVFDANRNNLLYNGINLGQLRAEWIPDKGKIHHTILIGKIPQQAHSMILYIWNKREMKYIIQRGRIELCEFR